ncbi:MAG: radical SAM protein [Methanosarcinales archaeon]|nr:radical SAM protein [Methanosarcinales archaeon]
MQIYENPLISIHAERKNDDKIELVSDGALSPVAKPVLKRINKIFAQEKAVPVGDAQLDDDKLVFSTWIPPVPSKAFNRMISAEIASVMKKRIPDQMSIGITMRCPNNCIHCGASDIIADPELTLDEINSVVDQSIDIGTYLVSFDGGEPMLRNDIVDMVANVDKTRAIATTFTSGFGVTPERAKDLKDAGLYAARVSIDSPDPTEHDRVRGRDGSFDDAMVAISNLRQAGIMTDMFVVVSPNNIDDLDGFYSLAAEKGMQEMSIYEIIAVGRWMEHEDEVISKNDVDRLGRFQKDMNKKSDGPRVTAFPYFMGPDMFGCFAGRRWLHVTSAGDACPCAYTPIAFGNIREEPVADIWKRMGGMYKENADYCLMRNPEFRDKYVKSIPEGAQLPYRMDR